MRGHAGHADETRDLTRRHQLDDAQADAEPAQSRASERAEWLGRVT